MMKRDDNIINTTKSEYDKRMLSNSAKERYIAYVVDFGILIIIFIMCVIFFEPATVVRKYSELVIPIVIPFLCIFRDVFGRSLGKYICRLKIISTENDEKPTIKQLILRNIIYLPYPDLITTPREGYRYGDKLAKTRVVAEADEYIPLTDEDIGTHK